MERGRKKRERHKRGQNHLHTARNNNYKHISQPFAYLKIQISTRNINEENLSGRTRHEEEPKANQENRWNERNSTEDFVRDRETSGDRLWDLRIGTEKRGNQIKGLGRRRKGDSRRTTPQS